MTRRCLLFLFTSLLFAANDHPASAVGIYENHFPAAEASELKVTLTLERDGKASFRQDYVGKNAVTFPGTWTVASDRLRVELSPPSGSGAAPKPFIWRISKDRLIPKEWDRDLYGKRGLPLRRPR